MTATTIRVQMAQRKDTAANWTAANSILLSGEIGYETDTKKFKIGNGSTAWNSLAYLPIPDGSGNLTITGNLEIGSTGSLTFEGSTADGFETTLAVTNPTADRTITLPDVTGTVITSGDTGSVTSTMLADGTIVNADVNANAAIAGTKISPDFGSQAVQTTGIVSHALGTALAPTVTFTGDTNTGLYSPGADQVAISTNGTQRLTIDGSGNVISAGDLYANGANGVVLFNAEPGNYNISRSGGDLTFKGTGNVFVRAGGTGANNAEIVYASSPYIAFKTANSERMRLDSSGRLGLGTSSPSAKAEIVSSGSESTLILRNSSAAGSTYSELKFAPFTGTTAASASIRAEYYTNNFSSLAFRTTDVASEPVTRLFIDGGGNVGIGTNGPSSLLHLAAASGTVQMQFNNGGTSSYIGHDPAYTGLDIAAGGGIRFRYFNGAAFAEGGRFDTSGRFLVGTSSARSNFFNGSLGAKFQIEGNGPDSWPAFIANDASTSPSIVILAKQRSGAVGGNTVVQSGDEVGRLSFQGSDGAEFVEAATIATFVDGTPGTNAMPGRIVLSTTASGASSPTERMRIGASGNVGIGQSDEATIRLAVTSTGTAYAGYFSYPGSTAQGVGFNSTGAGSSYAAYFFNNGTNVGSIYTTSSSTSYNTSSDYRLKENVVPLTGAIDRINELQVHRFNFIADPGKTVDGFIAHEAQAVVPECVTGTKDQVDDDGNPVYQGIDQSKLVPLLTAALQETLQKIEDLEGRLTAAGL